MRKYSFPDVLTGIVTSTEQGQEVQHNLAGIRIPMLQRDYAQGRPEETRIRDRFLEALYEAMESNSPLELDFVYGGIEQLDSEQYFIPLDGQQRLTTLFLLYWYIGCRELEGEELNELCNSLGRFSYATRAGAREFCHHLCSARLDFQQKPSQEIANAIWYYQIYRQDPTVASMLIVLDAIHARYNSGTKLYNSLQQIGFYILPLRSFQLTDELYIKMNARGKQLTDFENFKADLINWMQAAGNPLAEKLSEIVTHNGRKMSHQLALSLKLDNEWTKLFWRYAKGRDTSGSLTIDRDYLRFWIRYLLHHFLTDRQHNSDTQSQAFFNGLFNNENGFKYPGFEDFAKILYRDGIVLSVERTLDNLVLHHAEINARLKSSWNSRLSLQLFDENFTQLHRIIYFATTCYLEQHTFDTVAFSKWIRIIWNLASDPDIRSIQTTVQIMQIVKRLDRYANNIYECLASDAFRKMTDNIGSFIKGQLQEEQIKAVLILKNSEWEEVLKKAEAHPLFMGNIGFLISDKPTIEQFRHRLSGAIQMFSGSGTQGAFADEYKLMRAVIAQMNDWGELEKANLKDHADNWQLLLRRKATVKEFIRKVLDLQDVTAQLAYLSDSINQSSQMIGFWDLKKVRHIHVQLYRPSAFHTWLQQMHKDKAIELKWFEDHLYVHRPGSWYDRVMLDTYRNEMISILVNQYGFFTHNRCGISNFFWDYSITLSRKLNGVTVLARFGNIQNLRIGITPNAGLLPATFEVGANNVSAEWQYYIDYNYERVSSLDEIVKLIAKINYDFFDNSNANSFISKLSHRKN